jgi:hypothetical protein
MALDASILTRKYGPLPGWAWAGAAALGAWFLIPKLTGSKSGTTGTANAAASGSQLSSGYGLGYAQGLQAAQVAQPAQSSVTTSPTQSQATVPSFQQWLLTGVTGQRQDLAQAIAGGRWNDLTGQYAKETAQLESSGAVPGTGGPISVGGPGAKGSRSAFLMAGHHPLIKMPPRHEYFVRAVGGPGNHTREVARVAQQAGVHPARLMMLNPNPGGYIRVA